jgi:hypothetical protein
MIQEIPVRVYPHPDRSPTGCRNRARRLWVYAWLAIDPGYEEAKALRAEALSRKEKLGLESYARHIRRDIIQQVFIWTAMAAVLPLLIHTMRVPVPIIFTSSFTRFGSRCMSKVPKGVANPPAILAHDRVLRLYHPTENINANYRRMLRLKTNPNSGELSWPDEVLQALDPDFIPLLLAPSFIILD